MRGFVLRVAQFYQGYTSVFMEVKKGFTEKGRWRGLWKELGIRQKIE